jgi:hypothetical protein
VSPLDNGRLPAQQGDNLEPKPDIPYRALNAFIPCWC